MITAHVVRRNVIQTGNAIGTGVSPATGMYTVRQVVARGVHMTHVIGGLATVPLVKMDIGEKSVTNDVTKVV